MSLSDFRPIFLYGFKLNQSAAEIARKIRQAFENDSVGLRNIVPEILASKMSPEVVDLSNPGRGFEDPVGNWPITNGAWDSGRTERQLPSGF